MYIISYDSNFVYFLCSSFVLFFHLWDLLIVILLFFVVVILKVVAVPLINACKMGYKFIKMKSTNLSWWIRLLIKGVMLKIFIF